MLEFYFESHFTLNRLRSGHSGKYLDGFAGKLKKGSYSKGSARRYIRAGAHFGRFIEIKDIDLNSVNLKTIQEFQQHLDCCKCPQSNGGTTSDVQRGAILFFEYLYSDCFGKIPFNKKEKDEHEIVKSFRKWLNQHRGLSTSTQTKYCRGASELIIGLGEEFTKINAKNIRDFVIEHTREKGPGASQTLIASLRSFLSFLASQGICRPGLERTIPSLACWRQTTLPISLPATEIQRIIDSCSNSTVMGIRDRAIILLLARLGLRAGDASALKISDINWKDGSVLVSGKNKRQVRLPLSQETGDAILEYLKHRPQTKYDKLFLGAVAPYRPFISGSSLSPIVTRAMRKAGIVSTRYGSHILRHSAATEMLRQGVSLYEIGSVLRHRSTDMTAYYTKVDMNLLKLVSQPWPGGAQ